MNNVNAMPRAMATAVHPDHADGRSSPERKFAPYLPAALPLWRQAWPWLAAIPVLVALPLLFGGTLGLSVITQMCIAITFAVSYNLLLGGTGLLSFGHALYFGIGAYATAHVLRYFGESAPVVLLPLIGGVVALVAGAFFSLFTVRKGRVAFSMISLAVGQLAYAAATVSRGFSGGDSGIALDPTAAASWGIDFGSPTAIYFLTAAWSWVAVLGMFALLRTPLGRLMNATRDNAHRLEFVGFSPVLIRGLALTLSAGFAGIAGSLYALQFQVVTLDTLGLPQATIVMLQTYLGGYTSFIGPIVGAILLTLSSANLSSLTDAWPLYTYALSLLAIMFLPRGLSGGAIEFRLVWRARSSELGAMRFGAIVGARVLAALVLAAGCVLAVEMANSLSAGSGKPVFEILGPALARSPRDALNWIGAALLIVIGGLGLRVAQRMGTAEDRMQP